MKITFCFFPVLIFLTFLFLLDNFKLVRVKTLIYCFAWGIVCTAAAYFLNSFIARWLNLDSISLSRHVSPIIEESLKGMIIFYLISKKKIGFMIDAAIYGFASGAGFSLVENIWYIISNPLEFNMMTWIIRGFGTAIMHGGATALLAVLFIAAINRSDKKILAAPTGLIFAILLHAGFNYFPLDPRLQTLLIIVLLPIMFFLVFTFSNSKLQKWLEIELNSEVELLNMIRKGEFRSTKAGNFLLSMRERFTPEVIVDMYCYIALFLELSIKAKRNVMLNETGFPMMIEKDIEPKLKELAELRKLIGPVGEMALAPLIRMNYRSLWKLNQLKL
jgi:RsiW-degrading membrane proteinase PrsW (M82 family)